MAWPVSFCGFVRYGEPRGSGEDALLVQWPLRSFEGDEEREPCPTCLPSLLIFRAAGFSNPPDRTEEFQRLFVERI